MSFAALVGSYLMRASYTTEVSFATIAIARSIGSPLSSRTARNV